MQIKDSSHLVKEPCSWTPYYVIDLTLQGVGEHHHQASRVRGELLSHSYANSGQSLQEDDIKTS